MKLTTDKYNTFILTKTHIKKKTDFTTKEKTYSSSNQREKFDFQKT